MAVWTAICLGLLCFIENVKCSCYTFYGPSGYTDCVLMEQVYSGYQYVTCLTDSYIRARTGGRHSCNHPLVTYCYFQCMLELNNMEEGLVYENCSCDPNSGVTEQPATLPSWCYSPDGTSCQWNRQCLEKMYPCSNEENSYALNFGEKFCLLYDEHYDRFDEIGRTWIDAVRKCLQVSLVYLSRPYQHPTCDAIKTKAFTSQSGCYLYPLEGNTSICDIGFENWLQVLVTVHSALTYKRVIGEALVTAGECFLSNINLAVSMIVSLKERQLNQLQEMINNLTNAADDKLDDDVFMIVLNSDELTDTRLKTSTTPPSLQLTIKLLMLPRNKYDLNYNGSSNRTTEELITSFLDHVESREITYGALDGIELLEFRECNDTKCETAMRTVIMNSQTTVIITPKTTLMVTQLRTVTATPLRTLMPQVTTLTPNVATNFVVKLGTKLLLGSYFLGTIII